MLLRSTTGRLMLAALGLLSSACWDDPESGQHFLVTDEDVDAGLGLIVASPDNIDFAYVCSGATSQRQIELKNEGTASLTLTGADCDSSAFAVEDDLEGVSIAEGATLAIQVTFTPEGPGEVAGQCTFTADGEVAPTSVSLGGEEGGPKLEVPELLDFGPVAVGSTITRTVTLTSAGETSLMVTEIDLESTMAHEELWVSDMSVTTYPSTVESGDSIGVTLAMRPSAYQPYSEEPLATVTIGSSDCASSQTTVPVHGWPGGTDDDCVPVMEEGHIGQAIDDVDVLFVVDNSASMAQEQESMAEHFASFIAYADGLGIDYQIGVTTTDLEAHGGELQGDTPIVTPGNAAAFLTNVQVGTSGSDSEMGLEASRAALDTVSPAAMGGYLRPAANLAVIYVSDDDDHSNPTAGDPYFTSVSKTLESLAAADASGTGDVHAHAIVAMPPGCEDEAESYGLRYLEVAASQGGTATSICDEDFAAAFASIGVACFGDAATFHLERAADPDTVEVLVDGQACVGSWSMSPDVKSVIFDFDSLCFPGAGTPVVIRYVPLCWPG